MKACWARRYQKTRHWNQSKKLSESCFLFPLPWWSHKRGQFQKGKKSVSSQGTGFLVGLDKWNLISTLNKYPVASVISITKLLCGQQNKFLFLSTHCLIWFPYTCHVFLRGASCILAWKSSSAVQHVLIYPPCPTICAWSTAEAPISCIMQLPYCEFTH